MTAPSFDNLVSDFEFLDDWEERYKYVIELGKALPEFDEAYKCDAYKVNGCVSQVWIRSALETDDGGDAVMTFAGDSDALIVKGLIAVVMSLLSGRKVQEIVNTDARAELAKLGLNEHLSAQRSNGLAAMVARIQADAAEGL